MTELLDETVPTTAQEELFRVSIEHQITGKSLPVVGFLRPRRILING